MSNPIARMSNGSGGESILTCREIIIVNSGSVPHSPIPVIAHRDHVWAFRKGINVNTAIASPDVKEAIPPPRINARISG